MTRTLAAVGALSLLALVVLAFLPTGGASYDCERPPVAQLVRPAPRTGGSDFFGAGAACNDGARVRGALMGVVVVAGVASALVFASVDRRQGTTDAPVGTRTGNRPRW